MDLLYAGILGTDDVCDLGGSEVLAVALVVRVGDLEEVTLDEARAAAYDALFEQYLALHDHFGRTTTTMRRLKAIRRDAVARKSYGVSA